MTDTLGRILLVDDTESGHSELGGWLRTAGYRVVEAATGAEALSLADSDVDAVVLDVNLPDISGFEVCRILKESPKTAAIPVLHLTATAVEVADRTRGLTSGADGYLVEPVEPEELIATVAGLLRYSAARRKAERLARQLGALTSTTLSVNRADTLGGLLAAAADGAAEIFGTEVTIVAAIEAVQAAYVRVAADGLPAEPEVISPEVVDAIAQTLTAALGSAGAVIDTGVVHRDELRLAAVPQILPGAPGSDLLVSTLQARSGSIVGAVLVATVGSRSDGRAAAVEPAGYLDRDGDPLLLRQLGQSVAVALENLRLFHEEHRIALTLQKSLLPERLPTVPGLEFAARYNASSEHASVGGDFFDAFVLPDDSVCVAIGDVQGHSLQAATTMAELRYSLRAYAMEGQTPAGILSRLNDLLVRGHPEKTATAVVLRIDPDRKTVTFANAGHLPPLLVSEGAATFLETSGLLLGLPGPPPPTASFALPDDALIVLATDGLIERRRESLDVGLERLADAVLTSGTDLEVLCDRLLAGLARTTVDDDIALLALARRP